MNIPDFDNKTPLFYSCYYNSIGIIKLLLKQGADPNISKKSTNTTTFWYASRNANLEVMKLLVDNGFDCKNLLDEIDTQSNYSPFLNCCKNGHIACLKYIIELNNKYDSNVDLCRSDVYNYNAVMLACESNNLEMVKYLIEDLKIFENEKSKITINDVSHGGRSSLWIATYKGNFELVKYLHQNGADLNTPDGETGYSPLHYVCCHNNYQMVAWFIRQKGIDMTIMTKQNGYTPLMYVCLL